MLEPLSEAEIAEIEARANAATPGPWALNRRFEPWEISVTGTVPIPCHHDPPQDEYCVAFQHGSGRELRLETCRDYTQQQDVLNFEFIAACRTDVPRLIATIRALQREHAPRSDAGQG